MNENRVSFQFEARYYDNGLPLVKANHLLFAFHGQGHLGQYFIRKFDHLKELGVRVIVPEGLARYYLEGTNGRVGATWMTREDRLTDISNYLNYLNEVFQVEVDGRDDIPEISALGFSQGAATVSRWISQEHIRFDRLILWAGLFPPDLNWDIGRKVLAGKEVYFVYGEKDPYLSDQRFKEQKELSEQLNVNPIIRTFDGGHIIENDLLASLFS